MKKRRIIRKIIDESGLKDDYEYNANLMISTEPLIESQYALELGLKDAQGYVIFDNSDFLEAWNNVAWNNIFKLGCPML